MPEQSTTNGTEKSASPFSAPQIALPKGGGAIRGIDEKFTANPVTGTGAFSVPLAVSPGRSGFGPGLSLNYDSGSGNGIFGMGWSLTLPSILRRTDKGLPQYRDGEESDTFLLSGAEDLVPILTRDPQRSTRRDDYERAGYSIARYRPRIEGLFARIERWTCVQTGAVHWRSISRDNILTVYGLDSNSRVEDPEVPRHVFGWLICRTYDDRGNAILYDYAAENALGVDTTKPSERSRIHTANRYPKRIRYGNRRPLLISSENPSFRQSHLDPTDHDAAQWMFQVIFDYGEGHYREHDQEQQGQALYHASAECEKNWSVRKDSFSSFRSGFEMRTHRLCRRVLCFHHFPEELGAEPCLVRSTAFQYCEKPTGSFIDQVVQSGHKRTNDGFYQARSLPPLDFFYTQSPLENLDQKEYKVQEVDPHSLENLPDGIQGENYRWLDLDGEGISGVLTEQDSSWFYKRNLGNARFAPVEMITPMPSLVALNGGRQQLMDIDGSGNLDLVELSPVAPGFYGRTLDAGWAGFRPFHSLPVRDWSDPNLRFIDLTGDGIADVLITQDDAFTWHPSLLQAGFGPEVRVAIPTEDSRGPHIIFADGTQSIYLADMSGDGLSDIVRIRNGEICYWPNRGYGKFGARVTMNDSPYFDEPDLFDQKRIRLADTDGSGTADIIYLRHDGAKIFLNESGNSWSKARHVPQFPAVDNLSSVSVNDFLGRGTACLLWSSPLPSDSGRQLRYIDLMCGEKPHLLVCCVNNLGAETRIHYASSTQFYLADKAAGTPWVTRLPFPVHVVERVETYDQISRNRFVTVYSYHHGFYDGVNREFHGFGRVDQVDTEHFDSLSQSSEYPICENIDAASSVPPVLTRTWFHAGAYLEGGRISRHLAHEYYAEGSAHNGEAGLSKEQTRAMRLDDTILPQHLTAAEAREACRSLKGSILRQEVYALDGKEESRRPYSVTESNYTIRMLQRQGPNLYSVFFTHAREQVSFHYERKLYKVDGSRRADPRVSQAVTLVVDDYGNVLQSVSIDYGRRFADRSHLLTDEDRKQQSHIALTLTEADYTNAVDEADAHRAPLPSEHRVCEVGNLVPESNITGVNNLFRFAELVTKLKSNGFRHLPFEDWRAAGATDGVPYIRTLSRSRSIYRSNHLRHLLPHGTVEALALPGQNYVLAFTPELLKDIYRRGTHAVDLLSDRQTLLRDEGGYIDLDEDGKWWTQSGSILYAPKQGGPHEELSYALQHFFLPQHYRDPFGNLTTVTYDAHDLAPTETTNAIGSTTTAEIDYRVLAPRLLTDINGNRSEIAFDLLGMVAGMAVMGKPGENVGDSLDGFEPDLSTSDLKAFFAHPLASASSLLGGATLRSVYDYNRYMTTGEPAYSATIARETHLSDLPAGEHFKTQLSVSFSDGFGREIQKKMQAESLAPTEEFPFETPRWIASGWTIFNNKGNAIRKYEPFFSDSHQFEFATIAGVSPILFYDPVGRLVATLHPDHTFEKVVFDPWRQTSWDVNDTIALHPATDADVGQFLARLPDSEYLPTWYQRRIAGAAGAAQKLAAENAASHADTPTIAYVDSQGRSFLSIANNGEDVMGREQKFHTRTLFDIQGNQRAVIDAPGRTVVRRDYDMLGRQMHQASMEAGERWLLNDVAGKQIRAWDSRQYNFRSEYDALRRPTRSFVRGGDPYERNAKPFPCEILFERLVYGDSSDIELAQHHRRESNLNGKIYLTFDSAGLVRTARYDFKGNLLESSRQFTRDYKRLPDWSHHPELDSQMFSTSTTYDALNRVVVTTGPDSSRHRPTYNKNNLIKKLDLALRGEERDGKAVWTTFVTDVDYNAKGQRTRIDYANSATTTYDYEAETFRLVRLRTTRLRSESAAHIFTDPSLVQDLRYTYDPVGNIAQIADHALRSVFHDNRKVNPQSQYIYDPLYRLVEAIGRENTSQLAFEFAPSDGDYRDYPFAGAAKLGGPGALHNYCEQYEYDAVGNFQRMIHKGHNVNWTRHYDYSEHTPLEPAKHNNRLSCTHLHSDESPRPERYLYDLHGNIVQMPHLSEMRWDFLDRLCATSRQVVNCGTPETTFYVYDGSGQRVRKVTERQNGARKNERFYVDGFELLLKYEANGNEVAVARETLHVMDDKQRIALVETRTIEKENPFRTVEPTVRFQFANHLGSSTLELDDAGAFLSYEEYSPYGNTVYQAGRSAAEVTLKRYRYTGKERDEETGFTYHGARYCAPWLGRWTSCDPSGIKAEINLYAYAMASPLSFIDPKGLEPAHPEDTDTRQGWKEGTPTPEQPASPPKASAVPVEPDIVIEIPITGAPIDSKSRGFKPEEGRNAVNNYARIVRKNPRDYHLGHEKDNVLLQPGEKTRGRPQDRIENLKRSGAARKEANLRRATAEEAGGKAWEKTDPSEFARPGEREIPRLKAANKAAARASVAATPKPTTEAPVATAVAEAPTVPAAAEAAPAPKVVVDAPVAKPNIEAPAVGSPRPSSAGPSALEGFAGKIGSVTGVFLHILAVSTLAHDIEMIHDPGSPALGPVGTKRTDSVGTVWVKVGEKEWVTETYIHNMI